MKHTTWVASKKMKERFFVVHGMIQQNRRGQRSVNIPTADEKRCFLSLNIYSGSLYCTVGSGIPSKDPSLMVTLQEL